MTFSRLLHLFSFKADRPKKNKSSSAGTSSGDSKVDQDQADHGKQDFNCVLPNFRHLHLFFHENIRQFVGNIHPRVLAGGWWRIVEESDFRGGQELALEAGDFSNCYLAAQDNGQFTLGSKHFNELEPYPEEVLSLIKAPDDEKFSLKTGFGRYVGVATDGSLEATAEAVGVRERFEVVFQDVSAFL